LFGFPLFDLLAQSGPDPEPGHSQCVIERFGVDVRPWYDQQHERAESRRAVPAMFQHHCRFPNRNESLQPFQRFLKSIAAAGSDVNAAIVKPNFHGFHELNQ
jgi:hypothetical protein